MEINMEEKSPRVLATEIVSTCLPRIFETVRFSPQVPDARTAEAYGKFMALLWEAVFDKIVEKSK